jgi:hypothetical protein
MDLLNLSFKLRMFKGIRKPLSGIVKERRQIIAEGGKRTTVGSCYNTVPWAAGVIWPCQINQGQRAVSHRLRQVK